MSLYGGIDLHANNRVVSLSPADNAVGPVWSRLRHINRTVLPSHLGFPRPGAGRLPCPEAHLGPLSLMTIMLTRRLHRLRLRPWRYPKKQHVTQRPHMIGQSSGHSWRAGPPLSG